MSHAPDRAEVADLTRRIRLVQRRIRRCQSRGWHWGWCAQCEDFELVDCSLCLQWPRHGCCCGVPSFESTSSRIWPGRAGVQCQRSIHAGAYMSHRRAHEQHVFVNLEDASAVCCVPVYFALPVHLARCPGVAPSRLQMARYALTATPSDCPLEVQAIAQKPLRGSPLQSAFRFVGCWGWQKKNFRHYVKNTRQDTRVIHWSSND